MASFSANLNRVS